METEREIEDFRVQCRRQLARPVSQRIRFGFFRNPNPVRDLNRNRSFGSMEEYRRYCERGYPAYFGYARPARSSRSA
jgi:DNA primase catalytic subunit